MERVCGGVNREGWWVDGCLGKSSFLYSEDGVIFKGGKENKAQCSHKCGTSLKCSACMTKYSVLI